jgi:hypothetical protein
MLPRPLFPVSLITLSASQVGAYVLNFSGRVTMASVKNFQLVDPDEQNAIILQVLLSLSSVLPVVSMRALVWSSWKGSVHNGYAVAHVSFPSFCHYT